MADQKGKTHGTPAIGISEAERMAKIRELLVGPVIADESARVDESVKNLSDLLTEQQKTISALQTRIQELENTQRAGAKQLRARILGIAESLLTSDKDLNARLASNPMLSSELAED